MPTEEAVLDIITKEVAFPNGRAISVRMSRWHWDMVAFIELWNEHHKREHGILYEFLKQTPSATDAVFSDATMMHLRDVYNGWVDETPSGEEPAFIDPRS